MSTGSHPFGRDTSADVISAILTANPPSVTEIKEDIPRHLGRVIRHCLEKDPSQRFQTALDVRNELVGAARGGVQRHSYRQLGVPFPGRAREEIEALAWPGAGGCIRGRDPGGASVVRSCASPPQDLKTLAVLPFANLTGDPENDHLGEVFSQRPDVRAVRSLRRPDGGSIGGGEAQSRMQVGASEIGERLDVGSVVEGEILDEAAGSVSSSA